MLGWNVKREMLCSAQISLKVHLGGQVSLLILICDCSDCLITAAVRPQQQEPDQISFITKKMDPFCIEQRELWVDLIEEW